eukprot:NODE_3448_length_666_cov_113.158833_g2456_i0.p3 GENE.NODE_3448_length_666_cov_113.158833_g2456_i0~~NODE_3448_length_666_cov_113.158833_g2456_i0.p3  ORF type:complete len:144 (+),score=48.15 NODE_3448_length_666_cov_113.158833_g2456_i0:57-488(+)
MAFAPAATAATYAPTYAPTYATEATAHPLMAPTYNDAYVATPGYGAYLPNDYAPEEYTTPTYAAPTTNTYWHGAVPYAGRSWEAPSYDNTYGAGMQPSYGGQYGAQYNPHHPRYAHIAMEGKPTRPFYRAHVSRAKYGVFGHL